MSCANVLGQSVSWCRFLCALSSQLAQWSLSTDLAMPLLGVYLLISCTLNLDPYRKFNILFISGDGEGSHGVSSCLQDGQLQAVNMLYCDTRCMKVTVNVGSDLCPGRRTGSQLQMKRLSLRHHRSKFKTSGNLPISLEESIECST